MCTARISQILSATRISRTSASGTRTYSRTDASVRPGVHGELGAARRWIAPTPATSIQTAAPTPTTSIAARRPGFTAQSLQTATADGRRERFAAARSPSMRPTTRTSRWRREFPRARRGGSRGGRQTRCVLRTRGCRWLRCAIVSGDRLPVANQVANQVEPVIAEQSVALLSLPPPFELAPPPPPPRLLIPARTAALATTSHDLLVTFAGVSVRHVRDHWVGEGDSSAARFSRLSSWARSAKRAETSARASARRSRGGGGR